MPGELEKRIVDYMRPLFGEFAATAFAQQKAKLKLGDAAAPEEYLLLVEEIRTMCNQVAGPAVAEKIYTGLVAIVRERP